MGVLTESQFRGWLEYYDLEPWGEQRADWRQLAYQARWAAMFFGGGNHEPPGGVWPYFHAEVSIDELARSAEATEAMLEPLPGGGYRWKASNGSDDSRQAECDRGG
jgi:hypothetical protein